MGVDLDVLSGVRLTGYFGGKPVAECRVVAHSATEAPVQYLREVSRRYPCTSMIKGYSPVMGNRSGVSADLQS